MLACNDKDQYYKYHDLVNQTTIFIGYPRFTECYMPTEGYKYDKVVETHNRSLAIVLVSLGLTPSASELKRKGRQDLWIIFDDKHSQYLETKLKVNGHWHYLNILVGPSTPEERDAQYKITCIETLVDLLQEQVNKKGS